MLIMIDKYIKMAKNTKNTKKCSFRAIAVRDPGRFCYFWPQIRIPRRKIQKIYVLKSKVTFRSPIWHPLIGYHDHCQRHHRRHCHNRETQNAEDASLGYWPCLLFCFCFIILSLRGTPTENRALTQQAHVIGRLQVNCFENPFSLSI